MSSFQLQSRAGVFEIPANGPAQTSVYSGEVYGLAVDGQGDIFVADSLLNEVVEIPANGEPNTVVYGPISSGAIVNSVTLLVERQWLWRENRALAARLHHAQLKVAASLEDIDYRHPRGLKRAQIEQLRASQWVGQHRNCLITGPTGSGKTYLACALAHQACRDGHRVGYYYAPKLFRELQNAQADGSLLKLLKKLNRAALIVIDDFGVAATAPGTAAAGTAIAATSGVSGRSSYDLTARTPSISS